MHHAFLLPSGRLRIVLVEDCDDDAALLQMRLEDDGIDAGLVRVEDAAALRAALAQGTDIVLSDMSLPRFSGEEALQIVRAHDPRLPFVFLSGAGDDTAAAALQRGADGYLLKDDLSQVASVIALAIGRARSARARQVDTTA